MPENPYLWKQRTPMSDHTETIKARLREDTFGDYVLLPAVHDAIDSAFVAGLQKHDGGLWELAFAAGRGAERERIVAALEADYRANVANGADGIYTDGLHDAWRLTERRAKRDDLIKPEDIKDCPRTGRSDRNGGTVTIVKNPYRLAREVENDALAQMTSPSPREEGWDTGFAAAVVAVAEELRAMSDEWLPVEAANYIEVRFKP